MVLWFLKSWYSSTKMRQQGSVLIYAPFDRSVRRPAIRANSDFQLDLIVKERHGVNEKNKTCLEPWYIVE